MGSSDVITRAYVVDPGSVGEWITSPGAGLLPMLAPVDRLSAGETMRNNTVGQGTFQVHCTATLREGVIKLLAPGFPPSDLEPSFFEMTLRRVRIQKQSITFHGSTFGPVASAEIDRGGGGGCTVRRWGAGSLCLILQLQCCTPRRECRLSNPLPFSQPQHAHFQGEMKKEFGAKKKIATKRTARILQVGPEPCLG